jgi:serine/threonine protein kinase
MEGGSLSSQLRAGGLTVHQRFTIASNVASGLHFLHTEAVPPVIHQDVKSDNILLAEVGGVLVAKVADFGTARFVPKLREDGATHHSTQTVVGTGPYMPLEYLQMGHVSEKTDAYALGVVLCELLTGEPPANYDTGEMLSSSMYEPLEDPESGLQPLLDRRLASGGVDAGGWPLPQAAELGRAARRCIEPVVSKRASVAEVLPELNAVAGKKKVVPNCPKCCAPNDGGDAEWCTACGASMLEGPSAATAKRGWFCAHCAFGNIAATDTCYSCGCAKREEGKSPKPVLSKFGRQKHEAQAAVCGGAGAAAAEAGATLRGGMFGFMRWKRAPQQQAQEAPQQQAQKFTRQQAQKFTRAILFRATNNFDPVQNELLMVEGGSGKMFQGQLLDGRDMIVRAFPPCFGGDSACVANFVTEAETLGYQRHPNILSVLGHSLENKPTPGELMMNAFSHYLVYEFTAGSSYLHDRLHGVFAKTQPLTWDERVDVAAGVARGLAHLHKQEPPLLHRSFQSAFVQLTYNRSTGHIVPQIADCGATHFMPQNYVYGHVNMGMLPDLRTMHDIPLASPYAAPELVQGAKHSTKTDTFSCGVVFLELLTGMPPKSSEGLILTDQCRSVLETLIATGVTTELEQLIDWSEGAMRRGQWKHSISNNLHRVKALATVAHSCITIPKSQRCEIGALTVSLDQVVSALDRTS